MEIAFAFLLVVALCWMVWVERKPSKKVRKRLDKVEKEIKKLKEKNNARG